MKELIGFKKSSAISGAILLSLLMMAGMAAAAITSDKDTASVDVTVANKTLVDVSPNTYSATAVTAGNYTSADTSFDLENVGSKPLDYITASVSPLPTTNPFGTGVTSNYNAGNYLVLERDNSSATADPTSTDASTYHFVVNRMFNESADNPRYLTQADTGSLFEGRFRIDNEEYFWEVEPDSQSGVWGNGTLYVGSSPHNKTQLGDADLSDNTGIGLSKYGGSDTEGTASVTLTTDGSDESYTALINTTASPAYVELHHFSDIGGYYILHPAYTLEPGQSKGVNLAARVPYGVKEGQLNPGTLTFTATSEY